MKRILFVDDEKQILDGIRRLLSDQCDVWEMQFAWAVKRRSNSVRHRGLM